MVSNTVATPHYESTYKKILLTLNLILQNLLIYLRLDISHYWPQTVNSVLGVYAMLDKTSMNTESTLP